MQPPQNNSSPLRFQNFSTPRSNWGEPQVNGFLKTNMKFNPQKANLSKFTTAPRSPPSVVTYLNIGFCVMVHFLKDLWTPVGIISTRNISYYLDRYRPLPSFVLHSRVCLGSSICRLWKYLNWLRCHLERKTQLLTRDFCGFSSRNFIHPTLTPPLALHRISYLTGKSFSSHLSWTSSSGPGWLSPCQMLWHKPVNVGDCGIITGAPRSSPSKVCNDNLVTSGGVMAPVEPQETGLAEVSPFLSWHCQQCASYQHENITWAHLQAEINVAN